MYEAAGTMKWIGETQTFSSGFTKREFVVTTSHDKFPQDLKFEIVKDKCSMLDSFKCGQRVEVSFDIRGNEYNGKYFVNLSCWKLQASNGEKAQESNPRPATKSQSRAISDAPGREPSMSDLRMGDDRDDDPPF